MTWPGSGGHGLYPLDFGNEGDRDIYVFNGFSGVNYSRDYCAPVLVL